MAYTPAGMLSTSSGLANYPQIFYTRTGLDRLLPTYQFRRVCMEDEIGKRNGRTVQWFRYNTLTTPNTTPSTEGSVGTSGTISNNIVTSTVSEYSNYISVSTFLEETGIDSTLTNAAQLLGEKAGLSVDVITRTIIDGPAGSGGAVDLSLTGTYLRAADLRNAATQLEGLNVKPMEDGLFTCILHPYVAYDLVNDPSAGGLLDIFKYTAPSQSAAVRNLNQEVLATVANCKVIRTTNVKQVTGSPNKWRVYVFGKNGIGAVSLSGSGPSKVVDPSKQNFKINVHRESGPSLPNPEGLIAGFASYRYVYSVVILDGPSGIGGSYRYRTIDAPSRM